MQKILSLIQNTISSDAAADKLADVETYCERFVRMRPDLDPKDIRDVVLDAVVSFSGTRPGGGLTKH